MIYYIYKVRRKQTSIRSSHSALTHRYLRSISWISWKGISSLQAGFLPVLHPVSHPVRPPTTRSRIQLRSCCYCRHPEEKENIYWSFPEKKKNVCLPFFPHSSHPTFLLRCSTRKLFARAARSSSAAGPSRRLLRPSHKQKNAGPQHCAANPLTTFIKRAQKSVDFSLKKTHVGTPGFHALASVVLFFNNDGPHSLLPFFLSPFLQRKRKKKTEANSAGSNTSLGLTSFVLTMYAIGPSRLVR